MGKKRRILNNPKFAKLRGIRFPKLFSKKEPIEEQAVVVEQKVEEKIEQPKPVLKKDKPKAKAKPKAKLSSKKTTKAKASAKKGRKPTAKK